MARCLGCGSRWGERHECAAPRPPPAPSLSPVPLPPSLPRHRVGRLLGQGGYGAVWAAHAPDGAELAIKVAHPLPQAIARLENEAEALARLGPPTTPRLVDRGHDDGGRPWLALERLFIPSLAAAMTAGPAQAGPRFSTLAEALTAAVETVHAHGLVHRDLKPENIFYDEARGEARLIDFGLVAGVGLPRRNITRGLPGVGTAEYMAPEQHDGAGSDARADVYALGVILYELWTGRLPFFSSSAAELEAAHRQRRPPRPSEIVATPPPLEELLLACLAKDPAARPRDGAALRAQVAQALAAPAPARMTARPAARAAQRTRARRRVALLVLQSAAPLDRLRASLRADGGELLHADPPRFAFVFDAEAREHPVARALATARRARREELCRRAVVDVADVTVLQAADGARYLAGGMEARWALVSEGEPGVFASSAAASALPDEGARPAGDLVAFDAGAAPDEMTLWRAANRRLVGRDELVADLVAEAQLAAAGLGPVLTTVSADAGHGKSHLGAAVARTLTARCPSARLVHLSGRRSGAVDGAALRALALAALELPDDAPASEARARLEAALDGDEAAAAAARVLGWREPDGKHDDDANDDAALAHLLAAPGAIRQAAARAVGRVLRAASRAQPLYVIVDDAQYLDHATLDALEVATLPSQARLWALVLARPSLETARPSWGERAARHHRHALPPLSDATAAALCRELLLPAECVPDRVVARLVERTRGVPLLLVELIRGLKRDGLVRSHAHGEGWYLATDEIERVPELPLVEWAAERELTQLPVELALHARLAALMAGDITPAELDGVLGELAEDTRGEQRFDLDGGAALRRLAATGVLVQHRDGRAAFRHELMRDAVARAVPLELARRIHAAALRWYARRPLDVGTRAHLAHHASRLGDRRAAAEHYLALAEAARRRQNYVDAETLYSRALGELDDEARPLLQALSGRGQMRYRVSRFDDALADLARAQQLAEKLDDRRLMIDLYLDEATVRDWIDDYARAAALVARAEALAPSVPSPLLQARLLMGAGRTLWRSSRWQEAGEVLGRAVALAAELGDDGYETLIVSLLMRGEIVTYVGDTDEAALIFDRAIALTRRHDDRFHRAVALNNRRALWIARKDGERALADMSECMELAREGGVLTLEYFAQYNLAELLYHMGRDEAAVAVRRAIELQARRLGRWARPVALLLEARRLASSGALVEARAAWETVLRAEKEALAAGHAEGQLLASERVLLDMVDLSTRPASDAEWEALLTRSRQFSVEQEPIEVIEMRARAALRAGRLAPARHWFDEAQTMAARMPTILDGRIARAAGAMP